MRCAFAAKTVTFAENSRSNSNAEELNPSFVCKRKKNVFAFDSKLVKKTSRDEIVSEGVGLTETMRVVLVFH